MTTTPTELSALRAAIADLAANVAELAMEVRKLKADPADWWKSDWWKSESRWEWN